MYVILLVPLTGALMLVNLEPLMPLVDSSLSCSCLQTFVNDVRIQEQSYVTLKTDDKLRFGYDIL